MGDNGFNKDGLPDDQTQNDLEDTVMLRPVTDTEKLTNKMEDANERLLFEPGTILFYVAGNNIPKLVQNANTIIVGRQADTDPDETPLDLSSENAAELGVSRRHAAVHVTPQGYYLEDLKSTNGTWLNSNRLKAFSRQTLRSGDRVRFGDLAAHVYFTEQREELEKIHLQDASLGEAEEINLTPEYLTNEVAIYLQALADLQRLIDLSKQRKSKPTAIFSLRLDSRRTSIVVELTNVQEAANVANEFLDEVSVMHKGDIAQLRESFGNSDLPVSTRSLFLAFVQKPQLLPKIVNTMLDPVISDINEKLTDDIGIESMSVKLLKRYCFVLVMSPIKLREHVES